MSKRFELYQRVLKVLEAFQGDYLEYNITKNAFTVNGECDGVAYICVVADIIDDTKIFYRTTEDEANTIQEYTIEEFEKIFEA